MSITDHSRERMTERNIPQWMCVRCVKRGDMTEIENIQRYEFRGLVCICKGKKLITTYRVA